MKNAYFVCGAALFVCTAASGCGGGDTSPTNGVDGGPHYDLSIPNGLYDLSAIVPGADLSGMPPTSCSPTDPKSDGQSCAAAACPAGEVGVATANGCTCYLSCDPQQQTTCPCDRLCFGLSAPDAGIVGGACIVENGVAERCGLDMTGKPYGNGNCAQTLICAGAMAGTSYCMYECPNGQSDCPAQTTCVPINSGGMTVAQACADNNGPNGTKKLGDSCAATDICQTGLICDGTCKTRCDGPGAKCATGTCTAVNDGAKIIAYVCK
jgi:hypothetical protein